MTLYTFSATLVGMGIGLAIMTVIAVAAWRGVAGAVEMDEEG